MLFTMLLLLAQTRATPLISSPGSEITPNSQSPYKALIIAVADYQNPAMADLDTPVRDAQALGVLLSDHYQFQVTYLLNHEAEKDRIERRLVDLADNAQAGDHILIFFAGHGHTDAHFGYWHPWDADPSRNSTLIKNVTIQTYVLNMKAAQHVLVIADACFPAAFLKGRHDLYRNEGRVNYNRPSRLLITSGDHTEVLDSLNNSKHSPFAETLLNGLRQNSATFFTSTQLYSYLRRSGPRDEPTYQPVYANLSNQENRNSSFIFRRKGGSNEGTFSSDQSAFPLRDPNWKRPKKTSPLQGKQITIVGGNQKQRAQLQALGMIVHIEPKAASRLRRYLSIPCIDITAEAARTILNQLNLVGIRIRDYQNTPNIRNDSVCGGNREIVLYL